MRSLIRRARLRAPLRWLLLGVLAAGAAGCLDDRGLGPDGPSARLALRAQMGARAVTGLQLESRYLRADDASVPLGTQQLPLPSNATPGTSVELPVTLDLAPCLADPLHQPGGDRCTVVLTLILLDGARELDRVTIGPLTLQAGQTSELPSPVQLREAASVELQPATLAPLVPGQTAQFTARLLDASGAELTDREFTWASTAPEVATVSETGLVTAVAAGSTTISASAGGRSASVSVAVQSARIQLSTNVTAFSGFTGEALPSASVVNVTNAIAGPLTGLSVGTITYGGNVAPWLSATLSSGTAPASLTLRPSRTDLADGVYTAVVPVQSTVASNSPQSVTVEYRVIDLSNYFLFVDAGTSFAFTGETVTFVARLVESDESGELDDVPVTWSVSPASAGSFTRSTVTGATAVYVAGSDQGTVAFTAEVGSLSDTFFLDQNTSSFRRGSSSALSAGPAVAPWLTPSRGPALAVPAPSRILSTREQP